MDNDASRLIDAFCDQLWLQDGLAASSLASYRRDVTSFGAWLDRTGGALLTVDRSQFDQWLADQFQAKAKATSVARRLSALRRFYRFQLDRGAINEDPTLRVRAPKKPRRLPKQLSEAQVEALLAAPDTRTALGVRDRAMLETLYATGLRVSELTGLTRAQVAHDAGVVRVIGKGSKERLVPMGDEAVAWISRYLADVRPELAGTTKRDEVFLTRRRGPLTRQAFWALIKRYAVRAGIPAPQQGERRAHVPGFRPHRCRRTCCGMRSPLTCSITAPICASSSCSSVTPTSRRRPSTRTWRASD